MPNAIINGYLLVVLIKSIIDNSPFLFIQFYNLALPGVKR